MSKYRTVSNPTKWGTDCVVRISPEIGMEGLFKSVGLTKARSTARKVRGKRMADAVEMRLASGIDRREERRVAQRSERRAKRG